MRGDPSNALSVTLVRIIIVIIVIIIIIIITQNQNNNAAMQLSSLSSSSSSQRGELVLESIFVIIDGVGVELGVIGQYADGMGRGSASCQGRILFMQSLQSLLMNTRAFEAM